MGDGRFGIGSLQHDGAVELRDQLIVEGSFFDCSTPTVGVLL
ncbi:hypothetical protein [Pseudonocardia yunnanensis]|uniref:Uncharacterized protein n=1 Tax=Pseudonocardia yunnanensis TaxID=58107 RepID=A0ABW4EVB3_9PSEU